MKLSSAYLLLVLAILFSKNGQTQQLNCVPQNLNFVKNYNFEVANNLNAGQGWPDILNAEVCEWHRAYGIQNRVKFVQQSTKLLTKVILLQSMNYEVAGIYQENFQLEPGNYTGSIVVKRDPNQPVEAKKLVVCLKTGLEYTNNTGVTLPTQTGPYFPILEKDNIFLTGTVMSEKYYFSFNIDAITSTTYDQLCVYMYNSGSTLKSIYIDEIIIKKPLIINTGGDRTICQGDATMLGGDENNPTASHGMKPYVYQWYKLPEMQLIATTSNPVVSPSVTTSYLLKVTDEGGAGSIVTSTVNVTVNECECQFPITNSWNENIYKAQDMDNEGNLTISTETHPEIDIILSNGTVILHGHSSALLKLNNLGYTNWIRYIDGGSAFSVLMDDLGNSFIGLHCNGVITLDGVNIYTPNHSFRYTMILKLDKFGIKQNIYIVEPSGGEIFLEKMIKNSDYIYMLGNTSGLLSYQGVGPINPGGFILKIPINEGIPALISIANPCSITQNGEYILAIDQNKNLYYYDNSLNLLATHSLYDIPPASPYHRYELSASNNYLFVGLSGNEIHAYYLNGLTPIFMNNFANLSWDYFDSYNGEVFCFNYLKDNLTIEKLVINNNNLTSSWNSLPLPPQFEQPPLISVNSLPYGYFSQGPSTSFSLSINIFNKESGVCGCEANKGLLKKQQKTDEKQISNQFVRIFPNPVHEELVIEFIENSYSIPVTVKISSIDGKIICNKEFCKKSNTLQINVDNLTSGIYSVMVIRGNEVYSNKFVKL